MNLKVSDYYTLRLIKQCIRNESYGFAIALIDKTINSIEGNFKAEMREYFGIDEQGNSNEQ